jgi:hypothetical protein
MAPSKVPANFADAKSRELVGSWIASEHKHALEAPISADPITRLIHKDKQSIVYVAILQTKKKNAKAS